MPNLGFKPFRHPGGTPPVREYLHSASDNAAIAAGDAVIVDGSYPGYVKIALSNSATLLGVAQNSCAASTLGTVSVYDDPLTEFIGTCSGTSAQTVVNTDCDIEGGTGAMYVNEDLTTESVLHINELYDAAAANGQVVFVIKRHFKGNVPLTV